MLNFLKQNNCKSLEWSGCWINDSGRKIRWCGMLKRENEGVENKEGVETIVHGLKNHFVSYRWTRNLSMLYQFVSQLNRIKIRQCEESGQ